MLLPLLAGILSFVTVVGVTAWWMALPPRPVCPGCGGVTEAVAFPGPARVLERVISRRWCPACRWSGLARRGPVAGTPFGPSPHGSGFRWKEAPPPPAAPVEPPSHPSGFRWAMTGDGDEDGEGDTGATRARETGERAPAPGRRRWRGRGAPEDAVVAEGPGGQVRRLLRLKHAERAVGFRWAETGRKEE